MKGKDQIAEVVARLREARALRESHPTSTSANFKYNTDKRHNFGRPPNSRTKPSKAATS